SRSWRESKPKGVPGNDVSQRLTLKSELSSFFSSSARSQAYEPIQSVWRSSGRRFSPVCRLQKLSIWPLLAVASSLLSEEIAKDMDWWEPLTVAISVPVAAFQSRTVRSRPRLASHLPSGEK